MKPQPDIDTLLAEEGTRVEWKENVADVAHVVRTLSAFANDYGHTGGGWVICGIEERKDEHGFPLACKIGLDAKRYRELREKISDWCHRYVKPAIAPSIHDEPVPEQPERRLLVFYVAASDNVHWIEEGKGGTHLWYRSDSNTRQATSDVLLSLLREKGKSPPFLEEACPKATIDDLDPVLMEEVLRPLDLPRPVQDYLEPNTNIDARTPPLVVQDESSKRPVPTRLAVLLGCREPTRFMAGAEAVMAVYEGTSKSSDNQRFELSGSLPRLVRDVLDRLQTHIGFDVDKSASVTEGRQNRPRYARRAIEEAVVNAFVHRDYASTDPVRIDVYPDRIELWNSGGVRDLDDARLAEGKVQPSWRNAALVSFMLRLALAQNLGQGLTTIIEESQRVTGKRPTFHNESGWFGVILPALRPLLATSSPSLQTDVGKTGRAGILLITIGGPSIRASAEHSFESLALSSDDVLVDFTIPYIEPQSPQWSEQARRMRDELAQWVENPAYSAFHLFYRGPVVMAPLIGALIAPAKPLVLYHFEDGRYFPAYTLDRRFLHGASR